MDGAIGWGDVGRRFGGIEGFCTEIVPPNTAACFGFGEVRGITVDVERHIAGSVAEVCIRVHGSIVE